jgi:hypothetical protein
VSPNPVRSLAEFSFEAGSGGAGAAGAADAIEIFDAQGRFVDRLLSDPERPAGPLAWAPGHALPSGMYFARLTARGEVAVIKFAFVR